MDNEEDHLRVKTLYQAVDVFLNLSTELLHYQGLSDFHTKTLDKELERYKLQNIELQKCRKMFGRFKFRFHLIVRAALY
jgi:hypothetical protein